MAKIILLLHFILIWNYTHAIIAYDCSTPDTNYRKISLSTTPNCTLRENQIQSSPAKIQILQRKNFEFVNTFSCLITYNVIVTTCGGWWRDNMIATQFSHVTQTTRETCKNIHNHKLYIDPYFPYIKVNVKDSIGTYVGTVVGSNNDGECDGGDYYSHRNNEHFKNVHVHIEMEVKISSQKATLNKKDKTITFVSGYKALYDTDSAFDPQLGSTFWNSIPSEEECDNLFVVYEGYADKINVELNNNTIKTLYSLPDNEDNRNFMIQTSSKIVMCGESAFRTQSTLLFLVESSNGIFKHKKEEVNPKNYDNNLFLSMKISQLGHHLGLQMTEIYHNFLYELCISNKKIVENALALALLKPTDFGFNFFRQPGIISFIRSDVLYLKACQPTNVTHRTTDFCSNELPVTHMGKEKFLSPRSLILTDVGEIVPCSAIAPNTFTLDGHWYSRIKGELTPADQPEELALLPSTSWIYKDHDSIVDSGIYSKTNVEDYQKIISNNLHINAQTSNFIRHIATSSSFEVTRAFSLEDFYTLKERFQTTIWEQIKDFAQEMGNITSIVIGFIIIFKVLKTILNTVLNIIVLHNTFGWSSRNFLLSFWNHAVNITLHKEQTKRQRKDSTGQQDVNEMQEEI